MNATIRLIMTTFLLVVPGSSIALAEGLKIKDGLWETTMTSPMTGSRTTQECLKDAELDPRAMLEGQDDCRMSEQALQGNTLTFTMVCADGNGNAEGRMFVDGDNGGGEITMKFDMGGQQMDMTMTFQSSWLGDC